MKQAKEPAIIARTHNLARSGCLSGAIAAISPI